MHRCFGEMNAGDEVFDEEFVPRTLVGHTGTRADTCPSCSARKGGECLCVFMRRKLVPIDIRRRRCYFSSMMLKILQEAGRERARKA